MYNFISLSGKEMILWFKPNFFGVFMPFSSVYMDDTDSRE